MTITAQIIPMLPASVEDGTGIAVSLTNGVLSASLDYSNLPDGGEVADSPEALFAAYNPVSGVYEVFSLAGIADVIDSAGTLFPTRAAATASTVPAAAVVIVLSGHTVGGDAPLHSLAEVTNAGPLLLDQIQTNAGTRRWRIIDGPTDIRCLGVFPGPANATANVTVMNAALALAPKRSLFVPGADFYFNGVLTLNRGFQIAGTAIGGVYWANLTDGILEAYTGTSRFVFVGTGNAAITSSSSQGLHHGSMADIVLMCPVEAGYTWAMRLYGTLACDFRNVTMNNYSAAGGVTNPGGFLSAAFGTDPSWLNRLSGCEIQVPDTSNGFVLSIDWTDSCMIDCITTGGAGCLYAGNGNMEVIGGMAQRAATGQAAWQVVKANANGGAITIKFAGVNFDFNETYGLLINASAYTGSDTKFAVLVTGCHFRTNAAAINDIRFAAHPTLRMVGSNITGNYSTTVGGEAKRIFVDYNKWDINDNGNSSVDGCSVWKAYSPAVTAASGSFTTVSATGEYLRVGHKVSFWTRIVITTNNTAAGAVVVTLPFADTGQTPLLAYNATTENLLQARCTGAGTARIVTPTNTYPGANATTLYVSGEYEAT